jgi:hypothetical protein
MAMRTACPVGHSACTRYFPCSRAVQTPPRRHSRRCSRRIRRCGRTHSSARISPPRSECGRRVRVRLSGGRTERTALAARRSLDCCASSAMRAAWPYDSVPHEWIATGCALSLPRTTRTQARTSTCPASTTAACPPRACARARRRSHRRTCVRGTSSGPREATWGTSQPHTWETNVSATCSS